MTELAKLLLPGLPLMVLWLLVRFLAKTKGGAEAAGCGFVAFMLGLAIWFLWLLAAMTPGTPG